MTETLPLETRLRLRIDKLMDERDKALEQRDTARARADRHRLRAYENGKTTKAAKERARAYKLLLDTSVKNEKVLSARLRKLQFAHDFSQRMAAA
jgi:hypothetical protein